MTASTAELPIARATTQILRRINEQIEAAEDIPNVGKGDTAMQDIEWVNTTAVGDDYETERSLCGRYRRWRPLGAGGGFGEYDYEWQSGTPPLREPAAADAPAGAQDLP